MLLNEQFQKQKSQTINNGHYKNTFCRLIPSRVNIYGKQTNVGYKAPCTKKSNQPALPQKRLKKIAECIRRKFYEIDEDKNKYWKKEGKQQSHLQVIFFKNQSASFFQVCLLIGSESYQIEQEPH